MSTELHPLSEVRRTPSSGLNGGHRKTSVMMRRITPRTSRARPAKRDTHHQRPSHLYACHSGPSMGCAPKETWKQEHEAQLACSGTCMYVTAIPGRCPSNIANGEDLLAEMQRRNAKSHDMGSVPTSHNHVSLSLSLVGVDTHARSDTSQVGHCMPTWFQA